MPFFAPEEYRDGELLLRCFRPGDGEELNRATTQSYEHLRRFMLWPQPDTTVEESEGYARQSRARWLLGEEWAVGVWRGERLVAGTGFLLRGRPLAQGTGEIGMWVRVDEAGRGLGTRLLRDMVDWADADWPFAELTWHCDSRNLASARVAEKCGFQLEDRLRGHPPGRLRARPGDHAPVRPDPQRPTPLADEPLRAGRAHLAAGRCGMGCTGPAMREEGVRHGDDGT